MSRWMNEETAEGRIILVTGMSGAGRTSTLHIFEDIGFEAIDNLPLSLLSDLVRGAASGRALAIGVDIRTRDFAAGSQSGSGASALHARVRDAGSIRGGVLARPDKLGPVRRDGRSGACAASTPAGGENAGQIIWWQAESSDGLL